MAKNSDSSSIWNGITEEDFLNEDVISEQDIIDYNIPAMTLFVQNINLFRQLTMEKDGLKPIERRILYMMYKADAYMHSKNDTRNSRKCSKIVGDVMGIHAHGDGSIYATLVNNAQYWKHAVPLVTPHGNFGNLADPEDYGHMRYTEALISYYGYCCFFKDLQEDCLEKIPSTTGGDNQEDEEPLALPSRYPNILINGGFGMASGNLFCIPPFNIDDIIRETKKVMRHPEITSVYMVPDLPTGCDIVDGDDGIRTICETGKGKLKTRATIEIDQKKNGDWILKIKNVPWMVNFSSVTSKIVQLAREKKLDIKDIEDHSDQIREKGMIRTILDYWLILDKNSDPYMTRQKLYKLTQLEKPLSVDFNTVTNDLRIDRPSLRGLIQMWIDSRREYKRRLYNKILNKNNARITLLNILIYLTDGANIDKTVKILRTHSEDEAISALMKMQDMNSYQASRIVNMSLKTFNKDAHAKFEAEMKKLVAENEEILSIVRSNKKIDEIIADELDELREWSVPRKSRIVEDTNSIEVANTDHVIIVTKQNFIKKLTYRNEVTGKPIGLGNFKNNDFPKILLPKINNLETLTFFDMYGKFSSIPVHQIESTPASNPGIPIYNVAKLNGPVISVLQSFNKETFDFLKKEFNTKISIVSLSASGYIKKTPVEEFMELRNLKNVIYSRVRENDFIVYADILMDCTNVFVYTQQGGFAYVHASNVPEQSKQGTGLSIIKVNDLDECVGLTAIGPKDTHVIVVTEKGLVKRCEIEFLGAPGKRNASSYLSTLDVNDKIVWVGACNKKDETLAIYTRTEYQEIAIDDIPVQTRKAKGKKMISLPLGSNLIDIMVK